MSDVSAPRGGAIPIGEVANPPFARRPDPATHFRQRAQRFMLLSKDNRLGPYLYFLAGLAEAQHRIQDGFPEPDLPAPDARSQAREFAIPPLERGRITTGGAIDDALDRRV